MLLKVSIVQPHGYGDRHGRDRMVVVFRTTYTISAYHQ